MFPDAMGIYFVLSSDGTILYIGQSYSIRHRWSNHHKREAVRAVPEARLAWLLTDPETDLIALERSLIEQIKPPMNGRVYHPGRIRGGTGSPPGDFIRFLVRINPDLITSLRKWAERNHRSVTAEIVYRLERSVRADERKEPHER